MRRALAFLGGVFLAMAWPGTAFAQGDPITCVMTEEDVGNGYEYTVPGIGVFTVNGMEGETFQAAAFDMGEECFPVLYEGGEETEFEDGLVIDPGNYELRIYGTAARDGDYGLFRFQVENDYTESLKSISDSANVVIEDDPPLRVNFLEDKGMFRYTLPDGQYFEANVPVGGWARGKLFLSLSDGLSALSVRRDGEAVDFTEGLDFNQAGSYEVMMMDNILGTQGDISYRVRAGFQIYKAGAMNLSHVNAPLGLFVGSTFLEGQPVETGREFFHMEKDGSYRIVFEDEGGEALWEMEFVRDGTAPALFFDPYADGMLLHDQVSYKASQPEAKIRIWRNHQEVVAPLNRIAVNGVYHVEARDEAGNVRDYDFSIQIQYHLWDKRLLIIPFLLLLLAGGCFAWWRRNLRVL